MSQRPTTRADRPSASPRRVGRRAPYALLSTRPLHILAFLAPLIVAYEVCSLVFLTDPESGAMETIRAHRLMSGFFEVFGAGGLFLPGLVIVVVLLVWHLMLRDPWYVRPRTLGGMLLESFAWTVPLLVLWQAVALALPGVGGAAVANGAGGGPLSARSLPARLTIAVGAGIYEELLFRMLGIALLHFVACDLLRMRNRAGAVVAVIGSALAFALYHDVYLVGGGVDWARLLFFFLAGVYFGVIYLWRGFGVVVATHALYDVVVLSLAG